MRNRKTLTGILIGLAAAAVLLAACKADGSRQAATEAETEMPAIVPTVAPEVFVVQETVLANTTPEPLPTATPTPTPEPTPTPTPTPRGILDASYDTFFSLDGTVEESTSYRDDMISVSYTKVEDTEHLRTGKTLVYFVADIYVQDPTAIRRGMQYTDSFARSNPQKITALAKQYGAICAISGDYVTTKDKALVIWNGEVVFDAKKYAYDTLVLYKDGRMECFTAKELNAKKKAGEKLIEAGAWQTWSFGPTLLDGAGKPLEKFNLPDKIEPRNPRAVLGYYEPGHYCMVLIEGRQNGYSVGLSIEETAQLMSDLGCVQAYNLDGGISAQFAFMGKRVTHPLSERTIRDIVYVAPVAKEEPEADTAAETADGDGNTVEGAEAITAEQPADTADGSETDATEPTADTADGNATEG